jgi:opacity protein-like surface antigen
MRSMSLFVVCAAATIAGGPALAGPLEDFVLRGSRAEAYGDGSGVQPRYVPGSPVYHRWEGLYVGGQAGFASSGVGFSGGVADLVENILRNTTIQAEFNPAQWINLPNQAVTRGSFGGFIGYNVQFEDTFVGVEGNYNRTDIRMVSGDTIARVVNTSDGYRNAVSLSGTGSIHITDYGTLRGRFGWIYNRFIPYGFVGVAVARATVSRSASVSVIGTDANPACFGPPNVCLPPFNFAASQSDTKEGAFAYGWALGTGIDWAITSNLFLRGEYEYVGFAKFNGTRLHIQTVRAAAGIKF